MSDLREVLADRLDDVDVPPLELDDLIARGGRLRRRRRGALVATAVAATAAVVAGAALLGSGPGAPDTAPEPEFADVAPFSVDGGLRAYAEPGGEIHLGDRTYPDGDLPALDTDAVATPGGVVFYEAGRPHLLAPDGTTRALVDGPVDDDPDFRPTAQVDSTAPHVVVATKADGAAMLTVLSVPDGAAVAEYEVPCATDCHDLRITAFDDDTVFLQQADGTRALLITADVSYDQLSLIAGPRTEIVDVRGGMILFDGPAPEVPDWASWGTTPGPVDAQLTFDGKNVLTWSSVLQPVWIADPEIRLERGPTQDGALGFFALDTDGSVLVATIDRGDDYPDYTVYDCAVPSGKCEEVGPLSGESGDPLFIGADG